MFVLALLASAFAGNWAVIVAGSNGYGNYRHQTDACHATNILQQNGIPRDHIINFVYDDLADSYSNPYKGQLFNRPTAAGVPGVDVYKNCVKSYTKSQTTAANFLKVLTGDHSAPGPVLESTSEDNVFIYFTDHGAEGLIAFPVGGYLYANKLMDALKTMHDKGMYKKLVFYLEACESGSMFEGLLPADWKMYATTAANAHESSWGWYCPPEDSVNGKHINSCLGDEYSVRFMEDADRGESSETLDSQYHWLVKNVVKSHVMQYGDTSFVGDSIFAYMGANFSRPRRVERSPPSSSSVRSYDQNMHSLYYRYLRSENLKESHAIAEELLAEIQGRLKADRVWTTLARTFSGRDYEKTMGSAQTPIQCGECCEEVFEAYRTQCGGFSDYSFQYAHIVPNICAMGRNEMNFAKSISKTLVELC